MAEVTEGSATFSIPVGVSELRGRTARLDTEHNVEGREIATLTSVGRGAPTRAESERSLAILRILQGTLPLLDNHWVKAIWLPGTVTWPESFTTSNSSPPIEIVEHPDAPLNTSQHSALTHMLSPSLDDCITLVQGPPGTGKTTVIASYIDNAIRSGRTGIWLLAQSNVAVKNIAEKLAKFEFLHFKLIVSQSFHYEWCVAFALPRLIVLTRPQLEGTNTCTKRQKGSSFAQTISISRALSKTSMAHKLYYARSIPFQTVNCEILGSRRPFPSTALWSTRPVKSRLASISLCLRPLAIPCENYALSETTSSVRYFHIFSLRHLILHAFTVPPHGHDSLKDLQSVFELDHLQASSVFLNVQCANRSALEVY
jgi:hypothetical protein